ncbi:hypothetical protein NC997_03990 [Trichocoleus sp. DQ-A2]|nr:hypothetical protein [Coleofasciculus sp. FACHB-T130]
MSSGGKTTGFVRLEDTDDKTKISVENLMPVNLFTQLAFELGNVFWQNLW